MPVAIAIPLAAAAAGAIAQNSASTAASSQLNTAEQEAQSVLNPQNVENSALSIGSQNAAASYALQQQYAPWVTPLQSGANTAVLNQLGNTPGVAAGQNYLTNNLTQGLNAPTEQASINAALAQLNLGGQLGQDTQNAVTRSALAQAGGVTQGGLGLGRDVTAQDLGLTSLQLQQQRIGQGLAAGNQEQSLQQANQNNILNRISALSGLQQNQFSRASTGAQIGNAIQAPVTGLAPGTAASLAGALANSVTNYGQNQANLDVNKGKQTASGISSVASTLTSGGLGNFISSL